MKLAILPLALIAIVAACATDGPCIGFGTSCGHAPASGGCGPHGEGCVVDDAGPGTVYAGDAP
jgi:hypothetical protein